MNNEILKIEEFVWSKIDHEKRIGLLNGLSGIAMFYKYLSDNDKVYTTKLMHIVEKINVIISEVDILPSICSGLAGYGYLLTQLKGSVAVDESYFSDIDEILLDFLHSQANNFDYDFLHGSLGISHYFIERAKISETKRHENILSDYYRSLFQILNHNTERVLNQQETDKSNSMYFGLAHGVSGILNSIYIYCKTFDVDNKVPMLSINRLIDILQQYEFQDETFLYPNYVCTDNNEVIRSRLAWCQGDLGIANSLQNIGGYINNDHLSNKAKNLLNRLNNISLMESGIKDMGICHGTAGVLLLQWLSIEKAQNKNLELWKNHLKQQTKDFTEFKAFHRGEYIDEINILEGAVGVALTKLTIDRTINKNWISCLNLA